MDTKSNHDSFDDVLATWDLLHKMLEEKIIPTAKKRQELLSKQKQKFIKPAELLINLRQKITADISLKDLIVQIVQDFDLTRIYRAETVDEETALKTYVHYIELLKGIIQSIRHKWHKGITTIRYIIQQ